MTDAGDVAAELALILLPNGEPDGGIPPCPNCGGELVAEDGAYRCPDCRGRFEL